MKSSLNQTMMKKAKETKTKKRRKKLLKTISKNVLLFHFFRKFQKNSKRTIKLNTENGKAKKPSKLQNNPTLTQCRDFQLSGLLNWKNFDDTNETLNNDEEEKYKRIFFEDITKVDLEDHASSLEAILINPPWSENFKIENFVNLAFFKYNFNFNSLS